MRHSFRQTAVVRQTGYEGDRWVCFFWFVGWDCLSLGLHLCTSAPNIEIHVPFGFIRIGVRSSSSRRVAEPDGWQWGQWWRRGAGHRPGSSEER